MTSSNSENGMVMPVQPMGGSYGGYGYGYPMGVPVMPAYSYGNGGFGGDGFGFGGSWLILFLFAMMFGGFGNGWGGMGGFNEGSFPWLLASNNNTDNLVNAGFNQAATAGALSGIQSSITSGFGDTALGISGVNQNICQTGGQITAAVNNGFAQAEISNNARQIADMQQAYASQISTLQGMNAIQSQLAQCCCDNRAATNDLRYTVATEACADRAAVNDALQAITVQGVANTNALMTTINGGIQSIKDQLCNDKIDAKNERIAALQQQLYMKDLAASQSAQTAALMADNARNLQAVENYVRPQINPAYVVPNPYAYNFNPVNGWNNNCCNNNGCCGNNYAM